MTFDERLAVVAYAAGMSVVDVASRADVDAATVERWARQAGVGTARRTWQQLMESGIARELSARGLHPFDVITSSQLAETYGIGRHGAGLNEVSQISGVEGPPPEPVFVVQRSSFYLYDDVLAWLAPMLADRYERALATKLREHTRRARSHRVKRRLGPSNKRVTKHGYAGIRRHDRDRSLSNPWAAVISLNGKQLTLGYRATADEAARLYDRARIAAGFPPINFPGDVGTTMRLPAPRLAPPIMVTQVLRDIIDRYGPIQWAGIFERLQAWDPQPTTTYTRDSAHGILSMIAQKHEVVRTGEGWVLAGREGGLRLPQQVADEQAAEIREVCRSATRAEVSRRFGVPYGAVVRAAKGMPLVSGKRAPTKLRHPQSVVDAAVAAYQAGESSEKIAKRIGVQALTVLNWVRRAGVDVRPSVPARKLPAEARAEAVAAYATGESTQSIANRYGVAARTIRDWAREAGVSIRPRGHPPNRPKTQGEPRGPVLPRQARKRAERKAQRQLARQLPHEYAALYQAALAEEVAKLLESGQQA